MKRFLMLILTGIMLIFPVGMVSADSFEDALRMMDAEMEQQDQAIELEFAKQDYAYDAYLALQEKAHQNYLSEIESVWGKSNAKEPTKKEWVAYSKDRNARSSIDFEKGKVQIDLLLKDGEDINSSAVMKRLKAQLENLITKPAEVDSTLRVAERVGAGSVERASIYPLKGQLHFPDGRDVSLNNASDFFEIMLKRQDLETQKISTPSGSRQKVSFKMEMIPNHLEKRAQPYLSIVKQMSRKYGIPVSLVFAVMQTESYFNPMARSHVPAYGLMQLVPRSGARDAFQYVFHDDQVVTADYLYDPTRNIQLGSAYLKLLQTREMRRIKNPESRVLCAIAAYNTGGGNVAKAFIPGSKNIARASKIINQMSSKQVYDHLRSHLPYEETQHYVERVWTRMQNYRAWDGTSDTGA